MHAGPVQELCVYDEDDDDEGDEDNDEDDEDGTLQVRCSYAAGTGQVWCRYGAGTVQVQVVTMSKRVSPEQ